MLHPHFHAIVDYIHLNQILHSHSILLMRTLMKPLAQGFTALGSLFFISLPTWASDWFQPISGFDPKPFEYLGGGAAACCIAYFILQIVKLLRNSKAESSEMATALLKISTALESIAAMEIRSLAKEDAILARLEDAKIAMASVPDAHERLLETTHDSHRILESREKAFVEITKNQENIQRSLDRVENNQRQ